MVLAHEDTVADDKVISATHSEDKADARLDRVAALYVVIVVWQDTATVNAAKAQISLQIPIFARYL